MKRWFLACVSLAAGLAWSVPCRADDETAAAAADPVAPAAQSTEALPVSMALVGTSIQAEEIRAAIESELRVVVRIVDTPADEGLSVGVKRRRATVSFRSKGETTTRSLGLPGHPGQAVEVIALLAGNLARDEASELLARLAPIPSETRAPAPEPAPAPPPETPAPEAPAPPPPAPKPPEAPAPPKPTPKKPPADDLIRGTTATANLSFFHPTTLLEQTERRVINFELGAAYSRIGAIEGVGFTFGYLRVEKHVHGAIGSLGLTRVNGDVRGIQFGGFFNEGHGAIHGLELANFANLRWGNVEGIQLSGFFNQANDVHGLQVSGGANLADDVEGVQAGLVTVARDVSGAQAELVGVARDVNGAQLGLVNVARAADFQLGLVNVAERVDGAAIGLVSIAGNGYVEPTAYAIGGSRVSYNAGMKFVVGLVYSLLAVGTTGTSSDARLRTEVGGGLHVEPSLFRNGPVVDRTAFELGVHSAHTYRPEGEPGDEETLHYRAGLGVRFFRTVWLLGGYDVSHDVSPFGEAVGQGPWGGVAVF